MIRCPSCGEENPDRFRLCGFCGQALAKAEPAAPEVRKTVTVVFSDLQGRIDEIIEHHHTRLAEMLASLDEGPKTAYQVAGAVTWVTGKFDDFDPWMKRAAVGETLAQREADETNAVIVRQLRAAVSTLTSSQVAGCMVAYEPVWAIGTGKTATPADASAAHGALRLELKALTDDRAEAVPILYGGSVNRGNAAALLAAPEVDGVLVGGASLEVDGWSGLVRT